MRIYTAGGLFSDKRGYVIQVSVKRGHLGTRDDVFVGIGSNPTDFSTFYFRVPAHVIFQYDINIYLLMKYGFSLAPPSTMVHGLLKMVSVSNY